MSRLMLVLALSIPLAVLSASSKVHAWGAYNPPQTLPNPSTYHWNPNSSSLPLYPQEGVFQHNPPSSYGNGNNPYAGEAEGNWDDYGWGAYPYGGYGYGGAGYGGYGEGFYRGW